MRISQPFAIISAELSSLSNAENARRTEWLRQKLRTYEPVECEGSYQGSKEQSFIVILPSGDSGGELYGLVRSLARALNQESILYVDASGAAWLDYVQGAQETESIGHFKEVEKAVALEASAYTKVVGRYFVTY